VLTGATSKPVVAVPAKAVPLDVVHTLLSARVISIVICGNTLINLSKLEINPLCFPAFNFQSSKSHKAPLTKKVYDGQTEH
jgi:hypothetical protein